MALIYRCKTPSLGVSLLFCLFSKIIVVGSPLEPMACLISGSWFHVVEWVLNPLRRQLGYSFDSWAILVPVGISCHVTPHCGSHSDSWVRLMLTVPLLQCLRHLTEASRSHEASFRVSTSLIFPCSVGSSSQCLQQQDFTVRLEGSQEH